MDQLLLAAEPDARWEHILTAFPGKDKRALARRGQRRRTPRLETVVASPRSWRILLMRDARPADSGCAPFCCWPALPPPEFCSMATTMASMTNLFTFPLSKKVSTRG